MAPVEIFGLLAQLALKKSQQVGDVALDRLVFGFYVFFCHFWVSCIWVFDVQFQG
jgi:hypothetical protein